MYRQLAYFILALASLCSPYVHAEKYYFRHLALKNKLSQSSVLCIVQDRTGFMWFGTKDGLNRYDGSGFRIFKYNHTDSGSLGNNVVNALYENKDGCLWVGTDSGIYIYNPFTESFTKLECRCQDSVQITQPVIRITADLQGNIWMAVESQGLFRFDNTARTLTHYPVPDARLLSSLCIDQQNCVWIGYKGKGLYYSTDPAEPWHLFLTEDGENPFAGDEIFKILPERHNRLYTGSAKGGLKSIHILNRTVTGLLPSSPEKESVFVRNICPVGKDSLWIATERGIYTYNKDTKESRHFIHDPNDAYSLSDNAIYSIYRDTEGGIWVGSYFGGIDYYPARYAPFEKYYPIAGQNSPSGKVVREFCEDKNGKIWIGTEDGGLNRFDPETRQFTRYDWPGLHYNIHALALDDRTLWIGTYSKGLYALDPETGRTRHYETGHADNTLNDNNIYSMCHTSSGELYIGTPTGLNRYNRKTDDFTRIRALDGIFVFNILEDSKGNIWFATYNSGVFRYNPRNGTWKNYVSEAGIPSGLPYNKVISVYEDSKQRLWFGLLGRGFCSFDPDTEVFTSYDSSGGLANDVIYKIIESGDAILWLTSNKGLIRFDLKTETSHIYTDANGLLTNQFNYSSGIKSCDGTLYFGCIEGMVAFKPELFIENDRFPPVAVTDFLLFNKSAAIGNKNSPLRRSITYTDTIRLKYDQNSFAFRFAALCYGAPEENILRYTLEGFDKEWYATAKSAVATYTNLKPGHYTFCVQTANARGEWNGHSQMIAVYIAPPFWQSGWAYGLYMCSVFGALSGLALYFKSRNAARHRRQTEKFEQEKEREVYRAKIEFFTHVAHEIRTPLTLIKGPLEHILQKEDLDRNALKENLNVMERNTSRLLELTNQLLDFRKTETNGFRLNFRDCNISALIRDTYIRFRTAAEQNGLAFETVLPEEDYHAPVDKEALTKMLSNLFSNAVKYAASRIDVSLTPPQESPNSTFFITVRNDGMPIPAEMKEKIFEPFVQLRPAAGTGIGLPLARSLAELHRGKLYLVPGDGICFCIELPTEQEKAIRLPDEPAEKETASLHAAIRQHRTPACILVVEDNPEMLAFVSAQIGATYHVLEARNGKEALRILEEHPVHLVVSDVVMPETDGFELCRLLKTDLEHSHIPIILLTARITLQSKIEGIELGADDYIEKPFSSAYLLARIANLLSNQDKLRQAFTSSPYVKAQSMALSKADENFLAKLTEVIRKNSSEPEFNVDALAEKMYMSRSSLHRKIKGIAQITPNEFIQLERLKAAAQLIRSGQYRINEVCYLVGFGSSSYFAKCFQKQFGVLPKEFGK